MSPRRFAARLSFSAAAAGVPHSASIGTMTRPGHSTFFRLIGGALGLCLAFASTAAAPAQSTPEHAVPEAVPALLLGKDTSALAAEARLSVRRTGVRAEAEPGPLARFAELAGSLRSLKSGSDGRYDPVALDALIERLQAADLLMQARFEALARDERIQRAGLSAAVAERTQATTARWQRGSSELLTALRAARSAPADAALWRHVDTALQDGLANPQMNIYGADVLPVNRPRLLPRLPNLDLNIAPSYANPEEVEPLAEDFLPSGEARFSHAVLGKAAELGHDYVALFDFVRSQVRTEWSVGSTQQLDGTLRRMAGNDVEQASLLIALLRASGAAARYVVGVVELPLADLSAQIGVPESSVGQALAAAGVPHRPQVVAGQIVGFQIRHVWVAARVPYGNYRGTVADRGEPTWIPLMPALKPSRFTPGTPALEVSQLVMKDWLQSHLAAPQALAPWPTLRQQLATELAALQPPLDISGLASEYTLDAAPLRLLPSSTPYPVLAVNGEFALLPDSERQWLHVRLRNLDAPGSPLVLDTRIALSELASRRLSLAYVPATVEDQHLANALGGFGAFPAHLVRLRPSLLLESDAARPGTGVVNAGDANALELVFESPAGELRYQQTLAAGTLAGIAIDSHGDGLVEPESDGELDLTSGPPAAILLNRFAQRYLAEWSRADAESAAAMGVRLLRPLPALALALPQYRAEGLFGVVERFVFDGVALDAGLRPVEAISLRAANTDEADWLRLSALHGSALESILFEQLWAVEALSADAALQLAASRGDTVLSLTPSSGIGALGAHAQTVRDHVAAWLNRGFDVQIPQAPLTQEAWTGSAWRVENPGTGESGYFLSGGYAGGATVIPPALWYFQDLAAQLGDPYAMLPNDDPLSGVLVQLSQASQMQVGQAGEVLDEPLEVLVTDVNGRPVSGARVHFQAQSGDALLQGSGGDEAAAVTVVTDQRGLAKANMRLPTRQTGLTQGLVMLPGDREPQRSAVAVVEVAVDTQHGSLTPGEPYSALILPGPPTRIAFDHTGFVVAASLGPHLVWLHAYDQYDNEVSNLDVSFSTSDTYIGPICEPESIAKGTGVYLVGDCPSEGPVWAWDSCVSSGVEDSTSYRGIPLQFVPTSRMATEFTLTAHSAVGDANALGVTHDRIVHTPGSPVCTVNPTFHLAHWAEVNQLQAARIGMRLPYSRRFRSYVDEGGNFRNHYFLEPNDVYAPSIAVEVQGGSSTPVRMLASDTFEFDLIADASPGLITGTVHARPVWIDGEPHPEVVMPALMAPGWAVDLPSATFAPNEITLDAFQISEHRFRITVPLQPSEFRPFNTWVELLDDEDNYLDGCLIDAEQVTELSCEFERGLHFDSEREYSVRYTVNAGYTHSLVSAPSPVPLKRGIVAGFGGIGAAEQPPDLDSFIARRFPERVEITTEIDTQTGYVCETGAGFVYALGQPATVDLIFFALNEEGERGDEVWRPVDGAALDEGVFVESVGHEHLRFGTYEYELRAVADDVEEVHVGRLVNRERRRGTLPLSRPFVKGVDLFDGHAVVSVADIEIGGRGPGLRFTRTYSSHSGNDRTALGYGWHSDIDSRVVSDSCGSFTVIGGAGQGQRYVPAGTASDGTQLFRSPNGFHGTLRRGEQIGSFDFYAPDGTRYHYAEPGLDGVRLSFVEDTNDNRVTYHYSLVAGERVVQRIEDDAGRSLQLLHRMRTLERLSAGIRMIESRLLLDGIDGPLGLRIRYEYDDDGNLVRARREPGEHGGERIDAYGYADLGGLWMQDPDGLLNYHHFGFRLQQARNAIDDATRTYDYALGWIGVPRSGGSVTLIPEQRVVELVEPDEGVVNFAYNGLRGVTVSETTVTNARRHVTTYQMNSAGGIELETGPAGTTQTEWDIVALKPLRVEDALGTVTIYDYDEHGNRTLERIEHADGTLERSWTYVPPADFARPIKNRMRQAVDGRSLATNYSYDERGNLLGQSRGGVTEHFEYASNGDRLSHTDGLGRVVAYAYDGYGHAESETDELGARWSARLDARGRKLGQTDGNGHETIFEYDGADRLVLTVLPAAPGEIGSAPLTNSQRIEYNDAARTRIETDALDRSTSYVHDAMGRLIGVTNPVASRELRYDANGNLTYETDFRGNATTHVYDAANRRTSTQAPAGRSVQYAHDALGNVTREEVSGTGGSRVTEYEYRHPLYLRTHVRRQIDGARWAETVTGFDGNGNAETVRDAEGRVSTQVFDGRDRLTQRVLPEGRIETQDFDAADNRIETTLNTVPPQVQVFGFDARNREVTRTDATGKLWTTSFDGVGNVLQRVDPLGNAISFVYDPRGRMIRESGPLPGQVSQYGHDAVGNRIQAHTAQGQEASYRFDALNRLTGGSDQFGSLETLDYDHDDNITHRTDGEGRLTVSQWNGLNQETERLLPAVNGQVRRLSFGWSVHGELLSETDANSHTTSHTYDGLGQRITSTLPGAEGGTTRSWTFDAVGNLLSASDTENRVTTYTYDDLNRRESQTDPTPPGTAQSWSFDVAGNVTGHVDRRGTAHSTTFDDENRPKQRQRAGVTIETLHYDAAGRLTRSTDANGEHSDFSVDAAGNRTSETRPLGYARSWSYFPWGGLATATDADGITTTYEYDTRGRLEAEIDAEQGRTVHGYDGVGNRTSTTRPELGTWTYAFDAADRLTQVTAPRSGATQYEYDAHGNRTALVDAQSRRTEYDYDARHRLVRVEYPGGVEEDFGYDGEGNLIRHTDRKGQTVQNTVDGLGRVMQRDYLAAVPGEVLREIYQRDGGGNPTRIEQVEREGSVHITQRSYDAHGRLISETDRFGQSLSIVYDTVGNRIRRDDAAGTTTYQPDRLNRTAQVTVAGATTALSYTPAGRIQHVVHPNGASSSYTYDALGRIASLTHQQHGVTVTALSYEHDANGNRTEERLIDAAGTRTATYDYDEDDRLTVVEVNHPNGSIERTDYDLDGVGNRLRETTTRDNQLQADISYEYDNRHQLTERSDAVTSQVTTYDHDANGHLIEEVTTGNTTTYRPNVQDRLATLTLPGAPPVNFAYDADGKRVERRSATEVRRFGWDGTRLRRETNATNNTLESHDWAAGRILRSQNLTSTRYAQHDALASPIRWSRSDGGELGRLSYDAWGITTQTGADLPRIAYTGHYLDEGSNDYYAQQRYYRPGLGRFNRVDPWEGDFLRPVTLNKYLYANGSPLIYVDPDGRCGVMSSVPSMSAICAPIEAYMLGIDRSTPEGRQQLADFRRGTREGALDTVVDSVVGAAQLFGDFAVAGRERLTGERLGASDRLGATVAGMVETFSDLPGAIATYAHDRELAIRDAHASGDFHGLGDHVGRTQLELGSAITGTAGLSRAAVAGGGRLARAMDQRAKPRVVSESPHGPVVAEPAPAALPGKAVYVDSRGNAVVAATDLPTNFQGGRVIVPEGHQLSVRDRGLDAAPSPREGPFTAADREAFLAGTAGSTRLAPHHRHQLPVSYGGVIDELRGPGHPLGNEHTRGKPSRHPSPSIFRRVAGGETLRRQEIRSHWNQKGERLIEIEPGVWIDPGLGGR